MTSLKKASVLFILLIFSIVIIIL